MAYNDWRLLGTLDACVCRLSSWFRLALSRSCSLLRTGLRLCNSSFLSCSFGSFGLRRSFALGSSGLLYTLR